MRSFAPEARADGQFLPQIGTLNGNPIAAAAGLATLEILREPGIYNRLDATGKQLMAGLRSVFDGTGIPAQVIGEPTVFDLFLTDQPITSYRDTLSNNKPLVAQFNQQLLKLGIFRPDSKFYVSIMHTAEDVAATIAAFQTAAQAL